MTANVIPITREPQGSLYDLLENLAALLDSLDLVETPGERAEIEAAINAVCEAEVRKVDRLANFLAHLEAQQQFAQAEIQRLTARRSGFYRQQERLTDYIIRVMETAGLKKLEGRTNAFTLRPRPASVEITDEAAIPVEFTVTKTETAPDKRAIRAAMEAGEDVGGAALVTGRYSLVRR